MTAPFFVLLISCWIISCGVEKEYPFDTAEACKTFVQQFAKTKINAVCFERATGNVLEQR
jgi:hypothetical protein